MSVRARGERNRRAEGALFRDGSRGWFRRGRPYNEAVERADGKLGLGRTWLWGTVTVFLSQFIEMGKPSALSASPCAKNSPRTPRIHGS